MTKLSAFEIIPGESKPLMVILAEHAMNRLPAEYGDSGPARRASSPGHISLVTFGVEDLDPQALARLGVPAVLRCFSRLLIDPTGETTLPDHELSDGCAFPPNHPLARQERGAAVSILYHRPTMTPSLRALRDLAQIEQARLAGSFHAFLHHAWKGSQTLACRDLWTPTPRPHTTEFML